MDPSPQTLPTYNPAESYRWNYEHAPEPVSIPAPPVEGGCLLKTNVRRLNHMLSVNDQWIPQN